MASTTTSSRESLLPERLSIGGDRIRQTKGMRIMFPRQTGKSPFGFKYPGAFQYAGDP
jgi:hypothetical protein